jgi:hypothetical protein
MLLELTFIAQMLGECQDEVEPNLLIGLLTNNPYTISIMGAETATPPESEQEAISVIDDLTSKGISFNAGMMKIHSRNFKDLGLDNASAFNVCKSINAGAKLLSSCLTQEKVTKESFKEAYACYQAKNFLPASSPPMQLSDSDNRFISSDNKNEQPNQEQPKKAEPWDVFSDFTH